ncbi:MAG TPA: 3-phenylpropionate/cinnamic acid dioxygenase subunit beta [Burkholderiales bacterium]|jgi:3-phenylpropionate/cinnamic acid dioxygenase small subunit|nr:3-phenylpropionate/cinnamic acid dioxygenase subunit beta [Burkholderiales bacterium]
MHEGVIREVEQLLYREARMLDERRFHDWLKLFTDDIHYWMAARTNVYPKISKAIKILVNEGYREDDLPAANELAIYDETLQTLSGRVACMDTGMAWAEDPPSRTRHLITNIEVEQGCTDSEFNVSSNFLVYRNRAETEQDFYIGTRQDVVLRMEDTLKISRRRIVLDQSVILTKNVSIFF